jgi:hypothetical protein
VEKLQSAEKELAELRPLRERYAFACGSAASALSIYLSEQAAHSFSLRAF